MCGEGRAAACRQLKPTAQQGIFTTKQIPTLKTGAGTADPVTASPKSGTKRKCASNELKGADAEHEDRPGHRGDTVTHDYVRSPHSGAGNCVCGRNIEHRMHWHAFRAARWNPQKCICGLEITADQHLVDNKPGYES